MEWVETTGKTVDEAKEAALDQLGVHEDDAEFEVVEEPRTGLFGRTRGEARVRARVRPTSPRPKTERSNRRRRRPDAGRKTEQGGGAERSGPAPTIDQRRRRKGPMVANRRTGAAPVAAGVAVRTANRVQKAAASESRARPKKST